uniref:Polynucleotide kinase 3'-phosphatase n=1 Tax=Scleropages formosus TaxID=113540 RepID=A0A8C9T1M6_SCLFO
MQCMLLSTAGASLPLADGRAVIFGRGPESRVSDKKCSRHQVKLVANYEDRTVLVTQLGANPSFLGDRALGRGQSGRLTEGSTLYLVNQKYPFTVQFSGDSNGASSPTLPKANEIDPKETKKEEQREKGSLMIFTAAGVVAREKIAGFDLDGCIITTKSGKVFPTSPDDWRILYPEIQPKLASLLKKGFKVVFFTNQMGISRGKLRPEVFKSKVEDVLATLKLPIQVILTFRTIVNFWQHSLRSQGTEGVCFGDAAGRPVNWAPGKKKKDFSCSDRLFALNIGLQFHTPEEFFLGWKPAPFVLPTFNPRTCDPNARLYDPPDASLTCSQQEVVVAVGYPASGKSTFFHKHIVPKGYVYVNRDTLGSWQNCVSACERGLKEGRSVAVDNTNPDPESRKRYLDVSQKMGVPCRCFLFTTSLEQAKHNNRFREMMPANKHATVNDMIFHSYKNKFIEPSLSEGFSEILKIRFVPSFPDTQSEALYKQFSEG